MPKVSQLKTASQIAVGELADPEIRREHERTALAHAVAMRVIGYRIDHELSQTALARLLGMHQPAIARLEGRRPRAVAGHLVPASEGARPGIPHRHHPRLLRAARHRVAAYSVRQRETGFGTAKPAGQCRQLNRMYVVWPLIAPLARAGCPVQRSLQVCSA